jgi:hypothetical protein
VLSIGDIKGLDLRVKLVPKAHDFQPEKAKEDTKKDKQYHKVGFSGTGCDDDYHEKETQGRDHAY